MVRYREPGALTHYEFSESMLRLILKFVMKPPRENGIVRRINLFCPTGKATEMDKKQTLFQSKKRETRTNFVLENHF
jgi:hypothetical protein